MKKLNRMARPLMAVAMMTSIAMWTGTSVTLAQSPQTGTQMINNAGAGTRDWATPPAGSADAQKGYNDGVHALQLDTLAKRKIDAKASYLYKNPPVKKGQGRDEYLQNFEAGYNAALQHASAS
jgi:hypothetical protein